MLKHACIEIHVNNIRGVNADDDVHNNYDDDNHNEWWYDDGGFDDEFKD